MTLQNPKARSPSAHGAAGPVCDRSIAASQIDLAIRESLDPVDALGGAIARIANMLEQLGGQSATDPDALPVVHRMQAEVASCVQALQFHDCMIQHLSHVRDYLARGAGAAAGDDAWPLLRKQLRSRLITEDQRKLLDLLVGDTADPEARNRHSRSVSPGLEAGAVELFS